MNSRKQAHPRHGGPIALTIAAAALTLAACTTTNTPATDNTMETRTNLTTGRGNPLTLEGKGVAVGQPAPAFRAVNTDMKEVALADFRGKTVIITSFPSVDTSVCANQVRAFNQRAADLGPDVIVVAISMDLPFAQKRWCGAEGVERVMTLSDYKHREFAQNFGLRIRENGLIARATYVVDREGIIRYEEIVPEITSEPNYDAALAAARKAASA
jgi:thioredoxin-dependent peroxiredoxin